MDFSIFTIFPDLIDAHLSASLIGRARESGVLRVAIHDLRDYATDEHRSVDDRIFGGGPGMVIKPDVVAAALDDRGASGRRLVLTPAGRRVDQALLDELARADALTMLCGRYEGIDQRVLDEYGFEPVSIGDYVIAGGELAALVVAEGVARLLPGVMGNAASAATESFRGGLLEAPSYTRPAKWRDLDVPAPLLGGNHAEIDAWRRMAAIRLTAELRPGLLEAALHSGLVAESEVEAAKPADTIEARLSPRNCEAGSEESP